MSNPSIQLICSDIDGTLLDKDRELSKKTSAVFQQLSTKFPIVLISSRMPKSLRLLQQALGIENHPLIAYNGSLVRTEKETIWSQEIPLDVLAAMVDFVEKQQNKIHLSLYYSDEWWVPRQDYWAKREAHNTKVIPAIRPLSATLEDWRKRKISAHKVMCMGEAIDIERMYAFLSENFAQDVHAYRSKDTYIEVSHKMQDKASALELLLQKKYPTIGLANVVAFGDNYNDATLLEKSGWGVAVANAKKEILNLASYQTESNINDGVALFLEKHLL